MGRRYQNVAAAEADDEEEQPPSHGEQEQEEQHDDENDCSSAPSSSTAAAAAAEEQQQQQQHIGELPRSSSGDGILLDVHHHHRDDHHPPIPKRQLACAAALVAALWIVERYSTASVFGTVAQHEPSVRIFRALLEACLLLAGGAASIAAWTRHLGPAATAELLFQPAAAAEWEGSAAGFGWGSLLGGGGRGTTTTAVSAAPPPTAVQHGGDGHSTVDGDDDDAAIVEHDDNDDDEEDEDGDEDSHNNIPIVEDTSLRVPSPWLVLSAALDLLVWILVALVLYTVTAVHAVSVDSDLGRLLARIAAPTFPLLLFVGVVARAALRRDLRPVLRVVSFTLSAPFREVTFRDGLIGDVLTSVVRPLQDVAFTVFYILFGLRGWYSNSYFFPDAAQTERQFITEQEESVIMGGGESGSGSTFVDAADANVPAMEQSWIVHTVVLPACMISPLWWRFLQNMRQVYDAQQRWPYLGNALKYFCAASVAMTGVYHPHLKGSPVWLSCFVLATLYQIWWDLFMDWGLFVRNPETGRYQLRHNRLYPRKSFYWTLTVVNTLLRFCWTLSFVPLRYLSAAGVLTENFSGDRWSSILAPTIASAEIVRRTLWGLLRVEWEAIKVRGEQKQSELGGKVHSDDEGDDGLEMTPMKLSGGGGTGAAGSSWSMLSLEQRVRRLQCTSDMSSMSKIQILAELCLYTTAFAVVGLVAAAHRETL